MNEEIKRKIDQALKSFQQGSLRQNALNLFGALGYATDRQAPLQKPTKEQFKDTFVQNDARFNESKARLDEWLFVDLLFQLTKDEASRHSSLFDTKKVDNTIIETYLFFVIELENTSYSRTDLSNITREVNRLFPMPVMVLFKIGQRLTLSIINRRLHKRDMGKDVLEKVTVIKDIVIEKPHRAHIEILSDLSFDQLFVEHQFTNFVELHTAWQETLNIKELNKRFFQDLANWYFWALQYVDFPNDRKLDREKNLQINLIRLITRMIFVWFLKEKQLVPESLFNRSFIKSQLKNFDPEGDKVRTYYTAILQNLFFATLNQKMNEREFVKDGDFNTNREQHGIKNKYRYAKQFSISEKEVIELFKEIPFLNGGLFDCLDKDNDETGKHEYIDGFSREDKKTAKIPDMLFFGKSRLLDLSEGYGYKRTKENCRGLLEIFNDYKFTIEENTPIEEEIALDPELLGKVFENLLAYYTPETETTARKQTGSFYTPREIVEYMVDESLISYLKTQMLEQNPAWLQLGNLQSDMFGNASRNGQLPIEQEISRSRWKEKEAVLEENIRQLISYTDEKHLFTEETDVQELIYAIDHSKILDPACGSGAFPMGVLHKLVYVLRRLDKDNVRWRELQKRKAQIEFDNALNDNDKKERENKLIDINESFENNASDYGRKLYLIENCIYGVDIQPIAVQISKLRFFISLVVDQREKRGAENRGIRPLPNLETKFIAANTLIGLDRPQGLDLRSDEIKRLERELSENRHKHFNAKTRRDKIACQKADKTLRKMIADEIRKDYSAYEKSLNRQIEKYQNDLKLSHSAKIREVEKAKYEKARADVENKIRKLKQSLLDKAGIDTTANNIASFDIYDQNCSANWYEAGWMFGKELDSGFDIVIGNPPYGADIHALYDTYSKYYEDVIYSYGEIYKMFYKLGILQTKKGGVLTYITSNTFISQPRYHDLRKYLIKYEINKLINLGLNVFSENVVVPVCICMISNNQPSGSIRYSDLSNDSKFVGSFEDVEFTNLRVEEIAKSKDYSFYSNDIDKRFHESFRFEELFEIRDAGIQYHRSGIGLKNKGGSDLYERLFSSDRKQFERSIMTWYGKLIGRYTIAVTSDEYFNLNYEDILKKIETVSFSSDAFSIKSKILWRQTASKLEAVVDFRGRWFRNTIQCAWIKPEYVPRISLEYSLAVFNSRLMEYVYNQIVKEAGRVFPQVKIRQVKKLPFVVAAPDQQDKTGLLVSYLLFMNSGSSHLSIFFSRLVDAIIYEIYYPEPVSKSGCEVLKHLDDLPELKKDWSDEKKFKTIEKTYKELSNPSHPVSIAMFKMDTIEEISIIEGKQ